MFAPHSGRYLLISGAGLALLSFGVLAAWVPPSAGAVVGLAAGWALWGFFAVFFRDPERVTGDGIVAPADGRIRAVAQEGPWLRISTFMNVTDVHVNRFPLDAEVTGIETRGAGFRPAFHEESRHNLRRHYRLRSPLGEVEVIQMTGLVARRLVSLVAVGEARPRGSRLGMILLGSRVDVLLPVHRVAPTVRVGDTVRAGSSTIAREVT